MKSLFLILAVFVISSSLFAQKDSTALALNSSNKLSASNNSTSVSIYPVPVKDGQFTIKSIKEISSVRITNIIGQEIFKANYNNPEKEIQISLDNPNRGMYIVVITFIDRTRLVKKITTEGTQ
ncbi:MAG: T9SS type A sorting domain-containing protein [Bacteroidales bacterium]